MTNIPILFENDSYLVIDKPAGLVVHPDGRTTEPSVVDWVLEHRPELAEVGEPMIIDGKELARPGIVHRLDRETSGCLVLAKTQESFEHLKEQFKNSEVHKTYLGIVWGNIPADEGIVDAPIGKSPKDFRRWSAQPGKRGALRSAVTRWQVLHRGRAGNEAVCAMRFFPETGRTHQIRVHAKYMHHPLVCDSLYGTRPRILELERHALHAESITFHDQDGSVIRVESPVPPDMVQAFKKLGYDTQG